MAHEHIKETVVEDYGITTAYKLGFDKGKKRGVLIGVGLTVAAGFILDYLENKPE